MTTATTLPDGATLLGVVDGYEYLAVEWVYRRRDGGQLEYYATRSAWPETPAAQLAARDQIITDLRAQVASLEARLAQHLAPPTAAAVADPLVCPHCRRRCASGRGLGAHIRQAHSDVSAEPAECPACKRTFKNAAGLAIHRSNCPVGGVASGAVHIPIAASTAPIVEALDRSDWRCAICGLDTFAPGLHDITICMRCEQLPAAANGVEVAA